ncbi:hypothetical protein HanXRQr2_Chr05g0229181 [Helianthus annuus]|uniref:Uncharacterized protein n=1 Tax=Helianthus annuus TaxID=4232 RepID=A0A9K3NNQ5_HELAN|nr:hypothetical protein HanXRQr2_Chr05g0229181 [Helianthus annuus]KAJ0923819.1 hypothetical protein HanPSC8_Chr05g0221091 [Helianthus annuus]
MCMSMCEGRRFKLSHPNRWWKHRGAALGEPDCSRESITTIKWQYLKG